MTMKIITNNMSLFITETLEFVKIYRSIPLHFTFTTEFVFKIEIVFGNHQQIADWVILLIREVSFALL